mmetsp:Transcript_8678/g.16961  ORF Transcript_8678/g.16961 Transcript_8678/m.16961 type:complete len:606 (+) Transcript_8678:48-1865(+)
MQSQSFARSPGTSAERQAPPQQDSAYLNPQFSQGEITDVDDRRGIVKVALSFGSSELEINIKDIKLPNGNPVSDARKLRGGVINVYKQSDGSCDFILGGITGAVSKQKFYELKAVIEFFQYPNFGIWFWETETRSTIHKSLLSFTDRQYEMYDCDKFINSVIKLKFIEGAECPIKATLEQFRPLAEQTPTGLRQTVESREHFSSPAFEQPATVAAYEMPKESSGTTYSSTSQVTDLSAFCTAVDSLIDYAINLTEANPQSGDYELLVRLSKGFEASAASLPYSKKLHNCAKVVESWSQLRDQHERQASQYKLKQFNPNPTDRMIQLSPAPHQPAVQPTLPSFYGLTQQVNCQPVQPQVAREAMSGGVALPSHETTRKKIVRPNSPPPPTFNAHQPQATLPTFNKQEEYKRESGPPMGSRTFVPSSPFTVASNVKQVRTSTTEEVAQLLLKFSNGQSTYIDYRAKKLSRLIEQQSQTSSTVNIPYDIEQAVLTRVMEFINRQISSFAEHQHSTVRQASLDNIVFGPADMEFIRRLTGSILTNVAQAAFMLEIPSLLELCFERAHEAYNTLDTSMIAGFLGLSPSENLMNEIIEKFAKKHRIKLMQR